MFRLAVVFAIVAAVFGFSPARFSNRNQLQMSMRPEVKFFGTAVIAVSMAGIPAFAKEGAAAKLSFFGGAESSSPFSYSENREDPIYSPYSPYGDGSKAVYNARKGGKEEIAFWTNQLAESTKRVDKVPGYVAKKTWSEVTTELTRYAYNLREAALRLADSSKNPEAATKAAKAYFNDLNDMTEWAIKKNGDKVTAAYKQSQADLASFKALLK